MGAGAEGAGDRLYAGQIPILIDRLRADTLTAQIVEQIRASIGSGRIRAGMRLPSSRRLSEQLQVSRNTVVRAYEALEEEGVVETRPASGIFATARREVGVAAPAPTGSVARAPARIAAGAGRLSFDFRPGRPSAALFPTKTWRRLIQATLSRGFGAGLAQAGDPAGLMALRSAIASHLAASRGVVADPGQVVVVSGVEEALSLVARLLLGPGSVAAVENPTAAAAASVFEAEGARLHRVGVDDEGLLTDRLADERVGAALAYVTPSHQVATGATLGLGRRDELIGWARRCGCLIVEDDRGGDFRYDGSPLPAITALAPDCTAYIGSFAAALGPGLRVGYLVVPAALVDGVIARKSLLTGGGGWLEQNVLAEFIRSGSFVSHLLRLRARYREGRDAAIGALRRHFGAVDLGGRAAGLHLCWQLPPGVPAAARLEAMAHKARVGVYSLASCGVQDGLGSKLSQRGILLGHGSLTPRQIEQGIARLSDVIDDALDASPGFVDELLLDEPVIQDRRSEPVLRNGHKPALRAAPPHRAAFGEQHWLEGSMQIVRGIYRYPIKGLSAQAVAGVEVQAGKPFPFDRVFALSRPTVPVDEHDPKWAKKGLFVMLMLDEALAEVRTELDTETLRLRVWRGSEEVLRADLEQAEGRAQVEGFFQRLVPTLRGATPRLVRSRDGHFMDKPDNVVSLMNLATLRALEEQWGVALDPLRFRANFTIDGLPAWQEFDWVGSDIRLGDATFRVDRRNGRCGATNVNPATGKRDLEIPARLRASFGHKDLGVYLVVQRGGKVVVGDPVAVPQGAVRGPAAAAVPTWAVPSGHRHICRGCYYIHDDQAGGTLAELPASWRCPDCGVDKQAFRPYIPA